MVRMLPANDDGPGIWHARLTIYLVSVAVVIVLAASAWLLL